MTNTEMTKEIFQNTWALNGLSSQILRTIQNVDSMSNEEIKEMRKQLFEVFTEIRLISSCLELMDYRNEKLEDKSN